MVHIINLIFKDESLNETINYFNKWINRIIYKVIDYESYFLCLGDIDINKNIKNLKKVI